MSFYLNMRQLSHNRAPTLQRELFHVEHSSNFHPYLSTWDKWNGRPEHGVRGAWLIVRLFHVKHFLQMDVRVCQ